MARPRGGPAPSAGKGHEPAARTLASPAREKAREKPQLDGRGGQNLAQPSPRDNPIRQNRERSQAAGPSDRVGRGVTTQNPPGGTFRSADTNRAVAGRVLRNPAFANRPADGGPNARQLARSTFQGRFFDPGWRRHHARPIVIGWVGPLFWPYAYDDFVGYTFYPYAYDTFWPYAYDDLYDGMFGRYAAGYGGTYAAVGRSSRGDSGRSVSADLCSGQTAGLTDWPIERIAQTVEPDDAQRAALDGVKDATAKALDTLKASCPTELPSTPTGRIEAMRLRLQAMLQAVRIVRPAVDKFYQSLNDEQKARFNALGPDGSADQQQSRRDLTQVCGERASGIAGLPLERIERAVRPDEAQRRALRELDDATSEAVNLMKSDCPTDRALTPVGRLEAMEQRLDAMLRAVQTVQPALEKFYGSLGDEQKERFNRLSPAQG
jgi:LTXXQ motif family protein